MVEFANRASELEKQLFYEKEKHSEYLLLEKLNRIMTSPD